MQCSRPLFTRLVFEERSQGKNALITPCYGASVKQALSGKRIETVSMTERGSRRIASLAARFDQVGGLLADHDARRVGVAVDQHRHDRRVGHAQSLDAMDAELRVHYRHPVAAHLAGADLVVLRLHRAADIGPQLLAGLDLRPRIDLLTAQGLEALGGDDLSE